MEERKGRTFLWFGTNKKIIKKKKKEEEKGEG